MANSYTIKAFDVKDVKIDDKLKQKCPTDVHYGHADGYNLYTETEMTPFTHFSVVKGMTSAEFVMKNGKTLDRGEHKINTSDGRISAAYPTKEWAHSSFEYILKGCSAYTDQMTEIHLKENVHMNTAPVFSEALEETYQIKASDKKTIQFPTIDNVEGDKRTKFEVKEVKDLVTSKDVDITTDTMFTFNKYKRTLLVDPTEKHAKPFKRIEVYVYEVTLLLGQTNSKLETEYKFTIEILPTKKPAPLEPFYFQIGQVSNEFVLPIYFSGDLIKDLFLVPPEPKTLITLEQKKGKKQTSILGYEDIEIVFSQSGKQIEWSFVKYEKQTIFLQLNFYQDFAFSYSPNFDKLKLNIKNKDLFISLRG